MKGLKDDFALVNLQKCKFLDVTFLILFKRTIIGNYLFTEYETNH